MVVGLILGSALIVWPRVGIYARLTQFRELVRRQNLEDTLKHLHHCEFVGGQANLESLAGAVGVSRDHTVRVLADLEQAGLVDVSRGHPALTAAGRREALRVIRIHRLWENFLAERSGFDETSWHGEANRREHVTSIEQAEDLAASLGYPRFDPHGAPIPTFSGEMPLKRGVLLSELRPGQSGRIVHIEDEPLALHQQLVVQGLAVGAFVRLVDQTTTSLRVEVMGDEQTVAQVAAANVSVEPLDLPSLTPSAGERLSRIRLHQQARVVGLLPTCRGLQRRRLLDLGFVVGTIVEPEMRSALGDPIAYRVRGALIALRKDQAGQVQVEAVEAN